MRSCITATGHTAHAVATTQSAAERGAVWRRAARAVGAMASHCTMARTTTEAQISRFAGSRHHTMLCERQFRA